MALTVKVTANKSAILQKILNNKVFVEKGWIAAEKIARKKYLRSREIFFRDFEEHPVTQEIKQGPEAPNTSDLLNGEKNLFSFFGFEAGADPIGDLTLYLESQFSFEKGSYRNKVWSFKIKAPSYDEVAEYVVGKYGADYTTESWIEGVEKGYSGLNYYLRYTGKGRSGGGFQSKNEVNELDFRTTKYFSEICANFKRNIKR
jgi:hypothetical protein